MFMDKQKILEFVLRLIDIQLKKATQLINGGVGPDARLSAHLSIFAGTQLAHKFEVVLADATNDAALNELVSATYFFLICEHTRARAGWLLDSNNIHDNVSSRVSEQIDAFKGLFGEYKEETLSEEFLQHLFDSKAIAHKILDIAIKIKEDPTRTDLSVPAHALAIIIRNAQPNGRYHNEEIWREILYKHEAAYRFISEHKTLTQTVIEPEHVLPIELLGTKLREVLDNFKNQYPNSELFSDNPNWYEVGALTPPKSVKSGLPADNASNSFNPFSFFPLAVATAAATALFMYNM